MKAQRIALYKSLISYDAVPATYFLRCLIVIVKLSCPHDDEIRERREYKKKGQKERVSERNACVCRIVQQTCRKHAEGK